MPELTRERIAAIFADFPEPDASGHRKADSGIPNTKLAIWRALRGRPQDELTYGWVSHYAAGPDQKTKPTPNQFAIGNGAKALAEGIGTVAGRANRFYDFMDEGFLGKTWRNAEFMGEGYQEMYLLGSECILLAALRDGDAEMAERARKDIRRHLVLDALLRVPHTIPPRSVSIGARSALDVAPVQSMAACIISGRPPEAWGNLFGADLGRAAERLTYMGMGMLVRLARAGIVALPPLDTVPEIVTEIEATDLRAPWPMHWIADEPVSWYQAWLSAPFPNDPRAESTRGKSKNALTPLITAHGGISIRHVAPADEPLRLARPHDWHLEVGPGGLVIHRSPHGTPPPAVKEPGEPETPEGPKDEPEPVAPREYPHLAEARVKAGELHGRLSRRGEKRLALEIRRALRQHAGELGLSDDEGPLAP
jgi:hypothetical protein